MNPEVTRLAPATLGELAAALEASHSLAEAGEAVVDAALAVLPADTVTMTLRPPGQSQWLAARGPDVPALDALGARGALDALGGDAADDRAAAGLAAGELIHISDTRLPSARPDWVAEVAGTGIRSVLVVGLLPARLGPVTLDLYARRPEAFSPADTGRASTLAGYAGLAVRLVDRIANLEEALQTRDVIGQGQGIVMERYRLTTDQAMSYLRRQSQETNVKIRDLAQSLVAAVDGEIGRQP